MFVKNIEDTGSKYRYKYRYSHTYRYKYRYKYQPDITIDACEDELENIKDTGTKMAATKTDKDHISAEEPENNKKNYNEWRRYW